MSWDASFRFARDAHNAESLHSVLRTVAREFRIEVWRDKTDGALQPGDEGFVEAAAEPDVDGEELTWRFRFAAADGEQPMAALHFTEDEDHWSASISNLDVDPQCFGDFSLVFERIKQLLGGVDDDV